MRSITFLSSATKPMSRQQVRALGEECVSFDSHVNITGMLMHRHGLFLQVMEGPSLIIRDMFARISADPRHRSLLVISDRELQEREFEEYMGFVDLDEWPDWLPQMETFNREELAADPWHALSLLGFFQRRARQLQRTA